MVYLGAKHTLDDDEQLVTHMDPILSSEALKAVDQATMIREPISETDLMARAGERCAERIRTGLRNKEWGEATGCVLCLYRDRGACVPVGCRKASSAALNITLQAL
ncbi:MAG: hypothetical protein IPH63_08155 [Flavobacteriales bacterium]|nr:hypothetical protein [Flavobacteriales bacterium]